MEQQASPAAAKAKIHPEWSLWPLDGGKYSLSVYQCFVFILLISKMKHEVPSPKQKNNLKKPKGTIKLCTAQVSNIDILHTVNIQINEKH